MPCRYDDDGESAKVAERLQYELDLATRLLCDLTSRVPKKYVEAGTELEDWVAQHAEMDRKRLKAEAEQELADDKARRQEIKDLEGRLRQLKAKK